MYKTTVILKKGEGRTLKAGGLWVFDNEIAKIDGEFENGDIVAVLDFDGYFMGYGFINTNSKIGSTVTPSTRAHRRACFQVTFFLRSRQIPTGSTKKGRKQ